MRERERDRERDRERERGDDMSVFYGQVCSSASRSAGVTFTYVCYDMREEREKREK